MAQGHARMSAISVVRFVSSSSVRVWGPVAHRLRQLAERRTTAAAPVLDLSIIVFSDKSVLSRRSFKCAGKWQTGYKRRSGPSVRRALWKFAAAFVAQWKFNSNWQLLERNLIFTFKLAKQAVLQLTVDCQETSRERRNGKRGRTLVYPL